MAAGFFLGAAFLAAGFLAAGFLAAGFLAAGFYMIIVIGLEQSERGIGVRFSLDGDEQNG